VRRAISPWAAGIPVALGCAITVLITAPAQVIGQPSPSVGAAASLVPVTLSSLLEPRTNHTATLLRDGRVLVVGGFRDVRDTTSDLASAELWDPATGTSVPAGTMAVSRAYHTATLLVDGRVLIVGGMQRLAEVWDPETLTFSPAGELPMAVLGNTATLLPDGRVLVVGGDEAALTNRMLERAQIWDPATETFSQSGRLREERAFHTATLLLDGSVLLVGGETAIASAEVWDPRSGSFRRAGSLRIGRWGHTATLLPDGRVLVVGGVTARYAPESVREWTVASSELRDATNGTFAAGAALERARTDHTATLLPDGRVLVVGGIDAGTIRAPSEVWDPATQAFIPVGRLAQVRFDHTATLLPDGRVAIIGGTGHGDGHRASLATIEAVTLPPLTATSSSAPPVAGSSPSPHPGAVPSPVG
jgi:hypothetical protein